MTKPEPIIEAQCVEPVGAFTEAMALLEQVADALNGRFCGDPDCLECHAAAAVIHTAVNAHIDQALASKDAEIAAIVAERDALRVALILAGSRLHRCSIEFDTGTRQFIEYGEWTAEARAALEPKP